MQIIAVFLAFPLKKGCFPPRKTSQNSFLPKIRNNVSQTVAADSFLLYFCAQILL